MSYNNYPRNNGNKGKKKRYRRILKRMQSKLWMVFGLFCILFVILIGRLMYIEYTSGDKYEKIVLNQQGYENSVIPFQRGEIVDSKGTVLATSVDVYNVVLDCKVLNQYEDKKESTIEAVTNTFPQITKEQIEDALKNKKDSQYVVLDKKVDYDLMNQFTSMMKDEEKGDNIKGIWFEKEYKREYPLGDVAAALIGYCTEGNSGVIGIENEYNNKLNGTNGRRYGYFKNDNVENTVIEAKNGNTVITTIDANIQTIVEKEIKEWNDAHANNGSLGSKNTACIVMDPNNGNILAMASYPTFDLNNPRDLSKFYTQEQLAVMSEEEQMDFLNNLWKNYCVTNTYEPGSTFKPFTVAMGLESGSLNGDEEYLCDGGEKVNEFVIRCVNRTGHGRLDVEGALRESCNDALMQMVRVIGPDTFHRFQSIFGFGQKTNIDIPAEASTKNLLYTKEQLEKTESNLATNSFGQNFNVTMIQLASAYCSLINGGNLYQPHVVSALKDSAGNTIKTNDPVVMKKTISTDVSNILKTYMLHTVESGSASGIAVDGYNIGGKTGTAEKLPREDNNYLVSIIGFAPYENPEVVIYTVIDVPNVADQAHSSYAQEITVNILRQILPYLNVTRVENDTTP